MSVTFKTSALIEAAQAIVDRQEVARAEWAQECEEFYEDHYSNWWASNISGVRELRDYLTQCIKARKNPERAKAAELMGHSDHVRFYDKPGSVPGDPPKGMKVNWAGDLPGLIRLLKAHTADTISANELKLVGYDRLTGLFNAAAQAGGKL